MKALEDAFNTLSDTVRSQVENLTTTVHEATRKAKDAQDATAQAMRSAGETYSETARLRAQVAELRDTLNSVCASNAETFDAQIDTFQAHNARLASVEAACRGLYPPDTFTPTPEDVPPTLNLEDPSPSPSPLVTEAANAIGKIVGTAFSEILLKR